MIAETSFEVTNDAQTYDWKGHGVSIYIPKDSLPAESTTCRVEIRANLSGQYTLPADCKLVSGVYWIYCSIKFTKRIVLHVQHCSVERAGLSFLQAEYSQEELPYAFQWLGKGAFSKHSSHGTISLPALSSGWAIGKMGKETAEPIQYQAQVHYATTGLNTWQVLLAIRRDLDLEDKVSVDS